LLTEFNSDPEQFTGAIGRWIADELENITPIRREFIKRVGGRK
jgi:hypothetical protein